MPYRLNSRGLPNFGLNFYILNAKGEYAGVSMYEATYAVCTEKGPETAATTPLLEGKASDYVGEYRGVGGLGEEMVMRVSADSSGSLLLQSPFSGPTPRPLTPLGEGTFGLDDNRVRFVREDGRITGLSFDATYALLVLRRD